MSHENRKMIVDPDPSTLVFKSRSIFIRAIATKLSQGSRVFVNNMERRTAHYYKKRLGEMVKAEVIAEPVSQNGADGYIFTVRRSPKQRPPKHQG